MPDQSILAKLPKVDQVLASPLLLEAAAGIPRKLLKDAARTVLEGLRKRLLEGRDVEISDLELDRVSLAAARIARLLARPSLRQVVNATGVVVHTNLGRSLLAKRALKRLDELNKAYTNLEYDLEVGARGSRYVHAAELLRELTGAEAALVVNNNAAAVFLCLQTFASGRQVVVSRGQLVEIGGSFRIPDVMARSGAVLKEVGATNKTHLKDYEQAIGPETGMLLKVHTSNFAVVGFHKEVSLAELRALGDKYRLPVMEDLGSGTLVDFSRYGMPAEPTVIEVLGQGADLVTFSGDKLLGGPQAGIILGRADLIAQLRSNPMNRALRIDKLTLAALEATLELYREPEAALAKIPTLSMITRPYERLRSQANGLARRIRGLGMERITVKTLDGGSRVGGGALPLAAPRTRLIEVSIEGLSPTRLERGLREADPPVICRLEDGRLLMDVRTMLPNDAAHVTRVLADLAS